jgi:hypothetical protein
MTHSIEIHSDARLCLIAVIYFDSPEVISVKGRPFSVMEDAVRFRGASAMECCLLCPCLQLHTLCE